jgi:hypothetical protein
MVESMFVRCEDCNYENLAQHSFCGMCGAKLPSQRRVAPAEAAQPVPGPEPVVSEPKKQVASQLTMRGPSLLGLGSEPAERERVNYLLEDEPDTGRWGRWVAIIVLAAAVGGSSWHWRTEIRGWLAGAPQNSASDANRDANPAPPTTTAPAENSASSTTTMPATAAPSTEASAPAPTTSAPTTQTIIPPNQAVTDAVARAPEAKGQAPDAAITPPPAPNIPPQSIAPQRIAPQPIAPQAVAPPPVKPKVERKTPAADVSTDTLETQGENYLYGHGVPADCGLAGKNLLAAAARSSAKAQSVLGTMYATGHCVTRDVPTAYRWFAKSLHQDPGNVRIQRDLQVLWQQMTEEERKVATTARP